MCRCLPAIIEYNRNEMICNKRDLVHTMANSILSRSHIWCISKFTPAYCVPLHTTLAHIIAEMRSNKFDANLISEHYRKLHIRTYNFDRIVMLLLLFRRQMHGAAAANGCFCFFVSMLDQLHWLKYTSLANVDLCASLVPIVIRFFLVCCQMRSN